MNADDRPRRRKLLVASLGVATVTYALACGKTSPPGNLAQPVTVEPVGNPMAPPENVEPSIDAAAPDAGAANVGDAGVSASGTASGTATPAPTTPPKPRPHPTGGNLMAPRH